MSAGIISSTPIALPVGILATFVGGAYIWYTLLKLDRKLRKAKSGQEVVFTEFEAKILEFLVKWVAKNNPEV